jgi:uncharacterized membrane protein HdeD (DUF308 family)
MKSARGLTLGPEDAQNSWDAPHGYRVVAADILPGRLVLGLRAVLALLFGLTALFMIILAALFPRASTILIVQFYAGFVLLDGLLCLAAAARAMMRPLPRSLIALEGVVEVVTAIAAFVLIGNLDAQPRGYILLLMAMWAILTGVLELGWGLSAHISRGRGLIMAAALLSVAFGIVVLVLGRPDLVTAVWRLAVYVVFLGLLRLLMTFRLQGVVTGRP